MTTSLNPSMRPKVKGDAFFLPDSSGRVYFRNNIGSFSMEGGMIDQWIVKLMPVFNGENSLEELTDGLPDKYRNQVYNIAQTLYQNGFVRDVSQDVPHQLEEAILRKYASQIEFLDNCAGSGAYRFQCYRQAKVLAVGSGPFFASLVSALLESGLPSFHMLITESAPTNRQRLKELVVQARKEDSEVAVEEIAYAKEGMSFWREAVKQYDAIVYVSQESDTSELRVLHAACREENKLLLPAVCLRQAGLAGPLVHPDSDACWESALRRIHQAAVCKDERTHSFSTTAAALLSNVIVFELVKTITGVSESELNNKCYLLNLETLEGNWYSFLPHPLVAGYASAAWIHEFGKRFGEGSNKNGTNDMLSYFDQLTSAETGILHIWEEGDLRQLPLAQCRVQAVDPLSEGPAELLPETVCNGLTHEEARREAGLAGIEAYVSRLVGLFAGRLLSEQENLDHLKEFVGVGAGETAEEAVCRGLLQCLAGELRRRQQNRPSVYPVRLNEVKDERCQFYLNALNTMQGATMIGLGEELAGFPVVWVGAAGRWFGSAGLNVTTALRRALQQALAKVQNQGACMAAYALEASSVHLRDKDARSLVIPACAEAAQPEILQNALHVLKRSGKRIMVVDLALEPFLQEELAGVYGVLLREEESP